MTKKRALLFINSGLKNAGVPRIVVDIIDGLSGDLQFDLAVQSKDSCFFDKLLISKGCKIYYLGNPPKGRKGIIYSLFRRNLQVLNILRRGHYDIVHSFTAYQSGLDCAMAALAGVKVRISNTHGVVKRAEKGITRLYESICLYFIRKYATHRIGVSEQAAKSVFNKMSYAVVYNSVDFDKYSKILKQKHDGINLLQIGYFNENKNQLFSLRLLNQMLYKGENVHLYFVGYENEEGYRRRMDDYIEKNKLYDKVIILPHDYNKEDIFPFIDFVLLPSHHEGFSLVALESQAANIRCLVSLAVPEAVNIGLVNRLDLENLDQWYDIIESGVFPQKYDEERAKHYSRNTFLCEYRKIYSI